MLYNIPSAGYIEQTTNALVDGVLRCIERAHDSLQPARIYFNQGELLDASINRSPISYANNPALERNRYKHDTDKDMYLLRFVDRKGQPLAMLNWFAVHGTSMNNTNHLISSDNKGYAALLFEQDFNPPGTLPGKGKFVAIFAQANEGDVSPNTRGPRCIDTGLPCDPITSTCGNPPRNEKCIASGPGKDMFESTKIIAYKQYYKARQLFLDTEKTAKQVTGPVRFAHEHIDITKQQVPLYESVVELSRRQPSERRAARRREATPPNGAANATQTQAGKTPKVATNIQLNATYETCVAALGYSFAAGTTDGPGAFDFQQGDTASGRFWNMVRDFLRKPSPEQMRCHYPKPILLSTGEMDFPYMWHPKVVPTQILMIGQVAIVGLPGEFTTMAGRRVREAVRQALRSRIHHLATVEGDGQDDDSDLASDEARQRSLRLNAGQQTATNQRRRPGRQALDQQVDGVQSNKQPEVEVVLSGLSNIYTSYITTIEEYEIQRYEGASTLYGPHTLQAYLNQFVRLASHLAKEEPLPTPNPAVQPPDLSKNLFTMKAGVLYDGAPHGKTFGQVLQDVDTSRVYRCASKDQVSAHFVAGNPRNDLFQEQSFLYVDKFNEHNQTWTPIATDASWDTKFIWERTNTLFGESRVIITWDLPADCQSGVYRIRHYGAHKSLLQSIGHYSGKSSPFKVSAEAHSGGGGGGGNSTEPGQQQATDEDLRLERLLQQAEQSELLIAAAASGKAATGAATNNGPTRSDDDQLLAAGTSNLRPKSGGGEQRQPSGGLFAPLEMLSSMFGSWRWRSLG